ncbi:hypothetical protein Q4Q34_01665 [Flavivirga abyssicola]|uniref:hypothetical protein n=1 Tax=Flavivirga abyssicola TaxID=3063533 RepID=UPI0026DFF69B|nr:hypothetical protein [Flavivirga sp. MEBiC07777]WVK13747.1 hypothetical protein Q4Q34_01665 [Flavivirga sp. MEBiC07777]
MKKILILTSLLLAIIYGCEEDDYVAPYGDFSSFSWVTTEGDDGEYYKALNEFIGLYDLSNNPLASTWVIPEGVSILNTKFTNSEIDLSPFIIGDGPANVGTKQVNLLFNTPGVKEVQLRNTFSEEVQGSELVDGVWQITKAFTITVFDNIKPSFKVMKGDEEILSVSENDEPSLDNIDSWTKVIIEAGEELTYIDLTTTGEPSGRKWNFTGAKQETSNKDEAAASYFSLGTYPAGFIESTREESATSPKGEAIKIIPLLIEVIPSSKPFELVGTPNMSADGVLSFSVSGEIDTAINQGFTVNVKNAAANFDENIPVESVSINADDATVLELKLSAPTFNSDEIEISFSGGVVTSVDTRTLEDFEPVSVKIELGSNILSQEWASYESEDTNWRRGFVKGFWVGGTNDDGPGGQTETIFFRTTDKASDGEASMRYKFDISKNMRLQGSDFSKPNGIPAGTYFISYMVYLENGNTMKSFRSTLANPSIIMDWDIENIARGEWVEISRIETVDSDIPSGTRFDLSVDTETNSGVTGEQIIYFDDLKWIPLNPRI